MMLTQKPTSALRPHPQHRRMPSAPPLAVQPTKTPGLLTLARVPPKRKSFTPPKRRQEQPRLPRKDDTADEEPSFPICDDVSEIGDTPRLQTRALPDVGLSPPAPIKQRRAAKNGRPATTTIPFIPVNSPDDSAPKSAPLSASFSTPRKDMPSRQDNSPRQYQRTPSPKKNTRKKERKHKRSPSESIFHLSGASSTEDSDVDIQDQSTDDLQQLLAKMQFPHSVSTPSTPTRPTSSRSATAPKAARPRPTSTPILPGTSASAPLPGIVKGSANSSTTSVNRRSVGIKFAGSGFQNSPSPDELPDPGEL